MIKKEILFVFLFSSLLVGSCAHTSSGKKVTEMDRSEKIKWFTDARYGMFIHWAPSCIYGGEISWSRSGDPPDSWHNGGKIDSVLYDNSFKIFNPIKYNPEKWVKLATDAGMRYMVITTRHHDGFSMFDTKFSEYRITNPEGAYRKWITQQNPSFTDKEINRKADLIRPFADAVHKAGLKLGFYYSEPDWIREDYRIALTGRNFKGQTVSPEEQILAEKSYQDFMFDQLMELTTQYGRVDLIWFDAIKPSQAAEIGGKAAVWIEERTLEMIRRNQPGILINDRTAFKPDFVTNEGRDTRYIPGLVTESCTKLGDPYWSYSPGGTSKSSQWITDRLIINAGNNSNLLLNVGPGPEGEIPQIYVPNLLEAGNWLSGFGEAIYETHGGPFFGQDWGESTFRDKRVYLLLRNLKNEELVLPPLNLKLLSVRTLDDHKVIGFTQKGRDEIYLKLPGSVMETKNKVLVLEFDTSLEETN